MKIHKPAREKIKCLVCGIHTASEASHKLHFQKNHEQPFQPGVKEVVEVGADTAHQCQICQKSLKNRKSLKFHLTRHSRGSSRVQCEICKKNFSNLSNLRVHMKSHVNANQAFQPAIPSRQVQVGSCQVTCDMSAKSFSNKQNLVVHSKIHQEDCSLETHKKTMLQAAKNVTKGK